MSKVVILSSFPAGFSYIARWSYRFRLSGSDILQEQEPLNLSFPLGRFLIRLELGGGSVFELSGIVSVLIRQFGLPTPRVMRAVMARLCLALSLWHAPLPILHAHTLSLSDVDGNEQLVDHLVTFHHDDCLPVPDRSHRHSEWHWHFIIPGCQGCCSGDEPGSNPEDCCNFVWKYATVPVGDSGITSTNLIDLNPIAIDGFVSDVVFMVTTPFLDVERGHSGYVQSLASQGKISLQELLSRRLC